MKIGSPAQDCQNSLPRAEMNGEMTGLPGKVQIDLSC